MTKYIGIDPGKSGGIVMVDENEQILFTGKMPLTEHDLFDVLSDLTQVPVGLTFAMLERVNAGVFGASKHGRMGVVSAFTFGRGMGHLEMALTAARIPFEYVRPGRWQASMSCLSKGDKNVTKRKAQQLFPKVSVTHALADALLIAAFCRRVHEGLYGQTQAKHERQRRTPIASPAGS